MSNYSLRIKPKTFLDVNKQTNHNKDQSYWTEMAFLSTVHDLFLTFFTNIQNNKKYRT